MHTLTIRNGLPLLDGKPVQGLRSFTLTVDNDGRALFTSTIQVALRQAESSPDRSANNFGSNAGQCGK